MQVAGIKNFLRVSLMIGSALIFGQTLNAQQLLRLQLPTGHSGSDPIAFMRAPYFIHEVAGASLSAPPSSAFVPSQIRHAYGFDMVAGQGAGQTIAIVDAYDDANVESDLGVFSRQFNLPSCTTGNGCFRKLYSNGRKPPANSNWSVEISLDVEWAHAIAPQAKIVLVEAPSNNLSDLLSAVDVAVNSGASAVSMSWTSAEIPTERNLDNHFVTNGVTFVAASGDAGTGVSYPAASPYVVAVGGTSLTLDAQGNYLSEAAWSGSGGGLSRYENEPLIQEQFSIPSDSQGARGVPDVSYNANPGTGYAVYDSVGINGAAGWFQLGGTSAGAPQWAALVAITNSQRAAAGKPNLTSSNDSLYWSARTHHRGTFHRVTVGSNGSCGAVCDALVGYDYVTGLGSPQAKLLIPALISHP
jgi:subtilase family serine protease